MKYILNYIQQKKQYKKSQIDNFIEMRLFYYCNSIKKLLHKFD